MEVTLTPQQRAELEAAMNAVPGVRRWRRYQAVLLLADGDPPATVARTLRCSRASVYAWAGQWRTRGVAGLHEGDHGGGKAKLDAGGETALAVVLATDPQTRGHRATGWTVPLVRGELAEAGYAVADRTLRRALHRLGYRWKRPRYVLGRPDPDYEAKKGGVMAQAAAVLAAGGEVWVADETALREFPPLRASWSKRGEPATVLISGRNKRRTILGALNGMKGELVRVVRERCRTADVLAIVEVLGQVRPRVPKLLIWDNAPPHMPLPVRQTAATAGMTIAFLPFRSPELRPLEELWRGLKQTVAANRCYPSLDDLTERALAWLDDMSDSDRLRRCSLQSSTFDWLPT